MSKGSIETIGAFIAIIFLVGFLIFAATSVSTADYIQDTLSDQNLKIAIFNSLLASPCTNNDFGDRVELRKYIVDYPRTETESKNTALSCVNIGNTKYRIDIKDLETRKRWTFSNYQPVTPRKMNPDFNMIIQINANSKPAEHEGGYIDLDEYHKAILTANIETATWTDKLQDEMFCDSSSEGMTAVYSSGSNKVKHIYYYAANNCESGNCIKGPGQANATCQPEECTYSKNSGEQCTNRCECKSFSCNAGTRKCEGSIPDKLVLGQPCTGEYADYCESGICAINSRCATEYDTLESGLAHLVGTARDSETGQPVEGATIEIVEYSLSTTTDKDGDFAIRNIDLSAGRERVTIRKSREGYVTSSTALVLAETGTAYPVNLKMSPV